MKDLNETDFLLRTIWQKYQMYLIPKESQLSPHQVYFLKFLDRKKSCTPSEIAEQFDITLGAVTGFMDRLYKLGLITRARSEEDRRLVIIKLSEEGEHELQVFENHRAQIHQKLLDLLGEDEIQCLNQHMTRFRQVLGEISER